MAEVRREKDSLGHVEVPASAYYGAQTARAVDNYPISGMRAHPLLIRALGMVKAAAAEANKELGLVEPDRAEAISKAAQEVVEGKWNDEFVVDVFQAGAGVSLHMNTNEMIANRADEILGEKLGGGRLGEYKHVHPNDHVNYGQSTNDVFPTAMRLATLLALETLYPVLGSLAGTFERKAKEFDGVMKSGRTHMQDAVPIRLGQEFAAYAVAIRKAEKNIRRASDTLRELGLGGSAVGTGINTHPDYREKAIANLAKISGQKLIPAEDMRWAMQSNAGMADVSAALRGLALEDHPHFERSAAAGVGAKHGICGDFSAQPAAGLVDYAGEDQSGDAGTGGDGEFPGGRQRYRGSAGSAGRATGIERDDADDGAQRDAVDHDSGEHVAAVRQVLCGRDHSERSALPSICGEHRIAGDGAESLYWLRQSCGNCEGIGGQRALDYRAGTREEAVERAGDFRDSRSGSHDGTAVSAGCRQTSR